MLSSWVPRFSGVSTVQVQNATKTASVSESEQSQIVGLLSVLVSCISSGFAGVYFEKILKGKLGVRHENISCTRDEVAPHVTFVC